MSTQHIAVKILSSVAFAVLATLSSAYAATYAWTGTANNNFTDPANWGGSWNQWSDYTFGGTPDRATMIINDYNGIGSLTLESGLTTDIVIDSTANPIIMGKDQSSSLALITIAAASSNLTINGSYIASTPVTWDVGAGRTLTLNGPLNNWYNPASLVKNGDGTAVLTGSNPYTGGTTINGGTLEARRGTLGTGAVVINNGGTLYANDQWVLCGPNQYGENQRNIGTLTINAGGTLYLDPVNGFANGVANLYLNGGSITGGANSDGRGALFLWQGQEQITAGNATTSTISVSIGLTGNSNTITVETNSTLNITGEMKNSYWWAGFTGGFIKAGVGLLTLSGPNTYSGVTTVNGGTLRVTGRNVLPGSGGITMGVGATLLTDAANDENTQTISSTLTLNGGTLAAGAGTSAQNYNNGNPVGAWGNYYLAPGSAIQAGGATNSTISALLGVNGWDGYALITVDEGSSLNISGDITGVGYVSWGAFSKYGAGTLVLSGNNKGASQGMILSAGTVEFSVNSLPTNLRASGGPGGYSADIQGNATLRWASGNTQDISFENGSAQIRIADGVTATFDTHGNNVNLGTAFDLGTSQTGAIVKTGTGTMTLSGVNRYTGGTAISNGTLRIDGDSSSATGPMTVTAGASVGGTGSYGGNISLSAGAGLSGELNLTDCTLACNGEFSFTNLDFAHCAFTLAPGVENLIFRIFTLIDADSLGTATFASTTGTIAGKKARLYVEGNSLKLLLGERGTLISIF